MYTYSLQINQHLKLKKIISKAGQIFVFKIHPFIIKKKILLGNSDNSNTQQRGDKGTPP